MVDDQRQADYERYLEILNSRADLLEALVQNNAEVIAKAKQEGRSSALPGFSEACTANELHAFARQIEQAQTFAELKQVRKQGDEAKKIILQVCKSVSKAASDMHAAFKKREQRKEMEKKQRDSTAKKLAQQAEQGSAKASKDAEEQTKQPPPIKDHSSNANIFSLPKPPSAELAARAQTEAVAITDCRAIQRRGSPDWNSSSRSIHGALPFFIWVLVCLGGLMRPRFPSRP